MKRSTMVLLLAVAVILIAAGIIIDAVMGRDYRPDSSDYRTLYETEDGGVTEIRAEMLSSALRVYESSNDERLEISVSGRAGSSVSVKREGNVLTITEDSVTGLGARLSKEDINDYAPVMVNLIKKFNGQDVEIADVKAIKRPFGIKFTTPNDGKRWQLKRTMTSIGIMRIG